MQKSKKQPKYSLKVIEGKCISAATCVAIAEKTFQLDDKMIAQVIDESGNTPEDQLLAAQACPTGAIVVIDNETGEQVWPK